VTAATSLEERIAEVAVAALGAVFIAGFLVWSAGELGGWLAHHTWPPLGLQAAPGAAIGLAQHPADPTAGWPPAARRDAPPAWLYYALLGLLLAVLVATAIAIAARVWGTSPDYQANRRVPPGLARWPSTRRLQRPFLAWTGMGPLARILTASQEDCVAVIGPPRVGKTQRILIPQMLLWDGPAVSGSSWPDVLKATAENRSALAAANGGLAMMWGPTAGPAPAGVAKVGWSPLTQCEVAETCERRVRTVVTASGAGVGARHSDHWRENAISMLRGYFHAAARERLGVRGVLRWLARNELREPAIILGRSGSAVGQVWADELDGMTRVPSEELGSIFSAARTALAGLQNASILESCDSPQQFDIDQVLLTRSTVYLVVPTADQDLLAPLAAAMVEHLVQRAYDLWGEGRLAARLLLCLDELANITPLPSLLRILTQGGGRGVNLVWSVQSLAQMRDRYGEQVADAAFSSSRARLVFGGLTDTRDLNSISQLAGEHEVAARSLTRGAQLGQNSMTAGTVWRPRLPVSAIRGIPDGWAMLMYHTADPALVRGRLAYRTRLWRRAAHPRVTQPGKVAQAGRWLMERRRRG
jgi:type IV secretory pathway TraG/TraD family ATPase VirD4